MPRRLTGREENVDEESPTPRSDFAVLVGRREAGCVSNERAWRVGGTSLRSNHVIPRHPQRSRRGPSPRGDIRKRMKQGRDKRRRWPNGPDGHRPESKPADLRAAEEPWVSNGFRFATGRISCIVPTDARRGDADTLLGMWS